MKKIQVLLATYNGEKYIVDQINSVLINFERMPSYECEILISDDASTDRTIDIVLEHFHWCDKIKILSSERKGGVKNNFSYLIASADADIIFFCDQDDFWLPNKIATFENCFFDEEGKNRFTNIPVLVHSDLCVVDKDLIPVHISMFKYQKLNPNPTFPNLVVSNSVTGCVTAINRSLLSLLKKSSVADSIMHDWYIGLIATALGKTIFIPKSFILYRQHGNNQVGAKKIVLTSVFNFKRFSNVLDSINATKKQASLFLDDFSDILDDSHKKILNEYVNSFEKSWTSRLRLFLKGDVVKYGAIRNFVFFIVYVLLGHRIK
ncbi:Putative glycosyltransferase EpsE [Klebsiella pasteurii]|uniref:glycosyltransferase family 2 protein n=1 Tax=Klebsiella TaxID=570 RepID=UPI00115A918A|nr:MULTISPECIES: glycosyltransferase family 2 protein [Klebsiella]QPF26016.1 glycosyltransferase family 2 protein [Klebsiella sp. BDA134-6]VUS38433.1 Putative glycosyltransferase EpsE [Klebsiella pasteurii]VUS76043.1 Putative glycosyltransferase EpsE [Klebsiella pasteurii]VUS82061.1 Putative glycosyltransferase EpsE [Klebsiella pasteurii]